MVGAEQAYARVGIEAPSGAAAARFILTEISVVHDLTLLVIL
jgi:hypothetical protein